MPEQSPIFNLRTVDDLNKVLFVQRTITRQAKEELLAVASDAELLQSPGEIDSKAASFMAEEKKILEKYAKNPTLTEFNLLPSLAGATRWGATFGVTLLVGELILEQVKAMEQEKFEPMLRRMFLILLIELDNPKHKYLMEPMEKALKIRATGENGERVPKEEEEAFAKRLVTSLAESFLVVATEYGLVSSDGEGFQITDLGKRVLLHLLDAEKFIQVMVEAHGRFQTAKPKRVKI